MNLYFFTHVLYMGKEVGKTVDCRVFFWVCLYVEIEMRFFSPFLVCFTCAKCLLIFPNDKKISNEFLCFPLKWVFFLFRKTTVLEWKVLEKWTLWGLILIYLWNKVLMREFHVYLISLHVTFFLTNFIKIFI